MSQAGILDERDQRSERQWENVTGELRRRLRLRQKGLPFLRLRPERLGDHPWSERHLHSQWRSGLERQSSVLENLWRV
jgi:hypothetical protein